VVWPVVALLGCVGWRLPCGIDVGPCSWSRRGRYASEPEGFGERLPKADEAIKDLQRTLTSLALLDGRAVACREGWCLVWSSGVRDPRPIVAACREGGRPTVASLQAGLVFQRPPLLVTRELLGRLSRDLTRLEASERALRPWRASPRHFRRFAEPDGAWLAGRRERLASLGRSPEASAVREDPFPEWFGAVLQVVAAVRGDAARAALLSLARVALRHAPRQEALRRVRALAELLEDGAPGPHGRALPAEARVVVEAAAGVLRPLRVRRVGRRAARVIAREVARVVALPQERVRAQPARDRQADDASTVGERVLLVGAHLAEGLPSGRSREQVERVAVDAALCGLLFEPSEASPRVARALPAVAQRVADLVAVAPLPLTLDQAATLLEHGRFGEEHLREVKRWLGEGLPWAYIEQVALHRERWYYLEQIEVPAARRSFCQWHVDVLPRFEAAGVEMYVPWYTFTSLPQGGTADIAALGAFLAQRSTRDRRSPTDELALLDAALGVVRRDPGRMARVLGVLSNATPGVGRAALPEFGAWLCDDVTLDRFVHLSRLCGREPKLSGTLLRDFTRVERAGGELRHLQGLPQRSPSQELRLQRLVVEAIGSAPPSPDWTRRRLRERVEALFGEAYARAVDEVLVEVAREAWGVVVPSMTASWRDALRLLLGLETAENQEALRLLLRRAAVRPGASVLREGEANRRWLAAAAAHMDVDAWLTPHATDVEIGGRRYRLALEDDPLEVLRMGVPFDTCLSLEGGDLARFTVLNALDANKRVLYLRDEQRRVVARKLLAVSRDWTLLGYRLYAALGPDAYEAVWSAVGDFCRSLAERTGLVASMVGRPADLHGGAWHDDGTVAFEFWGGLVIAFCRGLGRPVPETVPISLRQEAARAQFGADADPEEGRWRRYLHGWPDSAAAVGLTEMFESRHDFVGAGDLLEHLPKHLEVTAMRDLFTLIDRLDRVWSRECPPRTYAALLHRTRAAARSAFVRDPDHRAVIETLRSRRLGAVARSVALHVAARFAFPRELGRRRAPLSWLEVLAQAPMGCPSAVAAVRALVRDHPALAADRDVARALLRQHPPAQLPPGLDLAQVDGGAPQHEWLGDLLLHVPRMGQLLVPSQRAGGRADRGTGCWRAAWRRREAGPASGGHVWRQVVAPRAMLADPAASARLGRGRVDPALVREALRVVAAWGGARQDGPDPASPETLAGALRFLKCYGGACFLDAEEKRDVHRAVALAVLGLPTEVVEELADQAGPWVEAAASDLDRLGCDADALLRMWELGLARSAVRGAVEHYLKVGDLLRLRERAGASDREELFDVMVADTLRSTPHLLNRDDRSMIHLFDAVLRCWDDVALIVAYRDELPTWVLRSAFLDRMVAIGVAARPGLRGAAAGLEWKASDEDQTAKAWLLDAIDRASTAGAVSAVTTIGPSGPS